MYVRNCLELNRVNFVMVVAPSGCFGAEAFNPDDCAHIDRTEDKDVSVLVQLL